MITVLLEQIIQLLKGWFESFNNHAEAVEESLTDLNNTASDIELNTDPIPEIRDNTGAVITPITQIKTNTDSIKTDVTQIKTDTGIIKNNANSIATSAGAAAAFAEDCATNTLDIKDKITTIASDTTQIRTNTGNTSDDVSDIKDILRNFAGVMTTTESASGPVCNFDTDLSENLVAYDFKFSATQESGTPAPADPKTITGVNQIPVYRTGKNMLNNQLNSQSLNGTTVTVNADKSITVSGTPSIQTRFLVFSGDFLKIRTACIFSRGTAPTGIRFYCTKNSGGTVTYPTLSDGYNMNTVGDVFSNIRLEVNTTYDGTPVTLYPMIELGSTVTAYAPYKCNNYTLALGDTYYGGSAVKTEDGEYNINSTYGIYDLTGSENWVVTGSGTQIRAFIENVLINKKVNANAICNRFSYGTAENVGEFDCSGNYLRFNISGIATDKATFNAWIANNPTSVVYEYANSTNTSMVASNIKTIKGINNIWCDTGDSEVTYKETLQHKIDKGV